jgi:phosphoserine aminotransferase
VSLWGLLARRNRALKDKSTRLSWAEASIEMTEKVVNTFAEVEAKEEEEDPQDLVTTKNTMLMRMDLPL